MTAERSKTFHLPLQALAGLFIAIAACAYTACSNSESVGNINGGETSPIESAFNVHETADSTTPASEAQQEQSPSITKYIPLDDTEYPYAGIPRIVIETENRREIKDRETEIPARLQIWGEKAPESEIMELTIRGRGNTSWWMPKKNYKIEFTDKQAILGMPKDRDWALISNYADKTLMKNFLMFYLSKKIKANYAPRCEFIELYLNKEYLGVYLFTETIKLSKNRVNIPKSNNSFLVEISENNRNNDQIIFSHIIKSDSIGKAFHVHYPKKAAKESLSTLQNHIEKFEKFLKTIRPQKENHIGTWIDIDDCIKHYWVQEFSKNPDAAGHSSVFFSWTTDKLIKMGPVWDFDLAFGSHSNDSINMPEKWRIKNGYWHQMLFNDSLAEYKRKRFWIDNHNQFLSILNTIDSLHILLQKPARNNFHRWKILQSTKLNYHRHAYNTYDDAVEDLKIWINERIQWIDKEISPP